VIGAAPAAAAPPLRVLDASALDATHVRLSFNQEVTPADVTAMQLSILPALSVTGRALDPAGQSVLLETTAQVNGRAYTVAITGIGNEAFVGALPAAAVLLQDDFNRPSGLLTTDLPVPGPWSLTNFDAGEAVLTKGPAVEGRSMASTVNWIDGETDNGYLIGKMNARDVFISAMIFIPSGQGWTAAEQAGLLRLSEYPSTAHARITAQGQTATSYTLLVNWKETSAYHGEVVAATGVTYDTWHWLQLRVKNGVAGTGVVQVWVDGRLAYQQNTMAVRDVPVTQVEAGIMHFVSTGPSATVYTDLFRAGTQFMLPAVTTDSTPPTGVALTAPAANTVIKSSFAVTATASDAVSVQRLEFLLDGVVVASDDIAPYSVTLTPPVSGKHTVAARAYDTSGNMTQSTGVPVTVDVGLPALTAAATPAPFSPNGDGYADTTKITFSTEETTTQRVQVLDAGGLLVKTLRSQVAAASGTYSVTWDGRRYDSATNTNVPVPDGAYTVRVRVTDADSLTSVRDLPVGVNRVLASLSRSASAFSPNGDGRIDTSSASYVLRGPATSSLLVEDGSGAVVRTLQAVAPREAGTYSSVWDGRDDAGLMVPDGAYNLRAVATTAAGTIDMVRSVAVDTTRPVLTFDALGPDPWSPAAQPLTFTITVDSAGSVSAKIYRAGSSTSVKTFTGSPTGPRSYTFTWDGVRSDGVAAAAGTYEVRATYTDKAGNRTDPYPIRSASFTLVR
jgi:flagellar hook assembly protein FlgD